MKIISSILFLATANAFQVAQNVRVQDTALNMGFFDFKPIHGSGSGASNDELEEQYKMQQEMVRQVLNASTERLE
jgi:hypothetical protein